MAAHSDPHSARARSQVPRRAAVPLMESFAPREFAVGHGCEVVETCSTVGRLLRGDSPNTRWTFVFGPCRAASATQHTAHSCARDA